MPQKRHIADAEGTTSQPLSCLHLFHVSNAVTLQIEVHQGALASDPDGVLRRLSERLGGQAHRDLRVAFAEWI